MTLLFILKFKTNHMQLQSAFCPCGFPILRFKELGVENYFRYTVGSLQMQGDDSALSYVICIKHCALMDLGIHGRSLNQSHTDTRGRLDSIYQIFLISDPLTGSSLHQCV